MALNPGTRLGPYEILDRIGAGGMGEVYKARDTKLGRDVAIKVLPALFAGDGERLARFRREAHVLASLNHPNIAAIYGFEDEPSTAGQGAGHALIMELVDGPTLDEVIQHGGRGFSPGADHGGRGFSPGAKAPGLQLQDALPIARQIATALDAAHEQGIIHRDLKPANIKVREDGTVKVLDFGLAKAIAGSEDPASNPSASPTLTARSTQLGMILGTAAYMAPEQAKARSVDRRADIWAFGAVLFEMLAGRRAFEGDDVSDVLASVLKSEPDWSVLPTDLPPAVRRLLARCLEKDPKRRLRDITEGMLQLDEGLLGGATSSMSIAGSALPPGGTSAPAAAPRPFVRRALPFAATAVLAAGGAWIASALAAPTPAPANPVRFQHVPPATAPLFGGPSWNDIAIAHDGQTLVYTTLSSTMSSPRLATRTLGQLEDGLLRGAEAALMPFFSPDDQAVGFVESQNATRLRKVPALGGPSTPIAESKTTIYGASWLADGTVVFGTADAGLARVADTGGDPAPLTTLNASLGDIGHRWPSAIPGTSVVLFTVWSGAFPTAKLAAVDVRSGTITRLAVNGSAPRYASTGHIIYTTDDGSLRAVAFDAGKVAVTGTPMPVLEGINLKSTGAANFDVSHDGRLVYLSGAATTDRSVTWVDRSGKETPMKAPPRGYYYARVSPNGARLTLDVRDQALDIWIWDTRGTLTRLTADAGADQYGLWTPNGQHVIFQSSRGQKIGIYSVRADGVGEPELIVERASAFPNAVSPDGKTLVFRAMGKRNDLFSVPLQGEHKVTPLLVTDHDELNAAFSPDGRWIAYQSDLSGVMEIYVRPFPNVDSQVLISTAGGSEPVWAPSGRAEVFYVAPGNKFMSVVVTAAGRELVPATPVVLFDTANYFFGGAGRNYDVAPDGRRFVMIKSASTGVASTPISFVLNWFEELKRLK